jgi:hypothetical protein
MGAIIDPFARCGDPFAGRNYRGMANDGHQIAVPARLRSENTKAVLAIVKGNSLDKSREYFLSSGGRYFRQAPSRCKATV